MSPPPRWPSPLRASLPSRTRRPARSSPTCPDLSAERGRRDRAPGRAAQPGWEALGFEGRGAVLQRTQKWIIDNARAGHRDDRLRDRQDARGRAARRDHLRRRRVRLLGQERARSTSPTRGSARSPSWSARSCVVRYEPLGLVGVIGPWNYPLANSFGDCIPALAAGNSVILKPSRGHAADVAADRRGPARVRRCPTDVFQVATGRGATGAALVDEVDMIMFTGSTETGKKVMARAAETLTPVSLELGGKDPMIVLRRRRPRARRQRRRLLLDAQRRPDLHLGRARLRRGARLRRVRRQGRPRRSARCARASRPARARSTSASMTFPPQVDIVERHVEDAEAKGARVARRRQARPPATGYCYEPTVLVDVDHTMEA